jgi:hypothetical protein
MTQQEDSACPDIEQGGRGISSSALHFETLHRSNDSIKIRQGGSRCESAKPVPARSMPEETIHTELKLAKPLLYRIEVSRMELQSTIDPTARPTRPDRGWKQSESVSDQLIQTNGREANRLRPSSNSSGRPTHPYQPDYSVVLTKESSFALFHGF